jgi:hypothetical protein
MKGFVWPLMLPEYTRAAAGATHADASKPATRADRTMVDAKMQRAFGSDRWKGVSGAKATVTESGRCAPPGTDKCELARATRAWQQTQASRGCCESEKGRWDVRWGAENAVMVRMWRRIRPAPRTTSRSSCPVPVERFTACAQHRAHCPPIHHTFPLRKYIPSQQFSLRPAIPPHS